VELGIGFAGVALAFGLTVLTMAFAVGHISGGHFNPAVTFGLWAGGRFPAKDVIGYVIAQVVGGIFTVTMMMFPVLDKEGESTIQVQNGDGDVLTKMTTTPQSWSDSSAIAIREGSFSCLWLCLQGSERSSQNSAAILHSIMTVTLTAE
jgi:glycerol uptake facilitator-like aquaporin